MAGIRSGSRFIFGADVEREDQIADMSKFTDDFHALVDIAVESGLAPLSTERQREFNEAKREVEMALERVIKARRSEEEAEGEEATTEATRRSKRSDILSLLLENDDPLTGKPFTDQKVVMLLKMSTNYTPAVAATWVLHLLAAHPDHMKRLVAEIDSVFSDGHQLSYDDLDPKVTPFLDAVVKETLRLYPTSPFAVRLVEDPQVRDESKEDKINKLKHTPKQQTRATTLAKDITFLKAQRSSFLSATFSLMKNSGQTQNGLYPLGGWINSDLHIR